MASASRGSANSAIASIVMHLCTITLLRPEFLASRAGRLQFASCMAFVLDSASVRWGLRHSRVLCYAAVLARTQLAVATCRQSRGQTLTTSDDCRLSCDSGLLGDWRVHKHGFILHRLRPLLHFLSDIRL